MADSFVPDSFTPDAKQAERPDFFTALGASARERAGEIGQLPGDLWQSVKKVGATLGDRNLPLRLAPMTVPGAGPVTTSLMNLGTEGLAQYREGEYNPTALALATLPAVLAGGARAARAGGRMATRLSQPRFQAAHQGALQEADDLVRGLTPDTQALYRQAQQAAQTAPPVPMGDTTRLLQELQQKQTLAPAYSPASGAARDVVQQAAPLGAGQPVALPTAVAHLEELNKAVSTRAPGADAAKLLSGSVVRDLEAAGAAGNQGASLARDAATAYKSKLGAEDFGAMVTKAAPSLTGVGPALNVANLEKAVRGNKDLPRLLGPQGMQTVEAFIEKYRGLPPDHAAQFFPMLLSALSGSGAGTAAGYAAGGPMGAAVGGLAGAAIPEYLRNLFYVGANPKALNRGLTLAGQAGRVAVPGLLEYLRGE